MPTRFEADGAGMKLSPPLDPDRKPGSKVKPNEFLLVSVWSKHVALTWIDEHFPDIKNKNEVRAYLAELLDHAKSLGREEGREEALAEILTGQRTGRSVKMQAHFGPPKEEAE